MQTEGTRLDEDLGWQAGLWSDRQSGWLPIRFPCFFACFGGPECSGHAESSRVESRSSSKSMVARTPVVVLGTPYMYYLPRYLCSSQKFGKGKGAHTGSTCTCTLHGQPALKSHLVSLILGRLALTRSHSLSSQPANPQKPHGASWPANRCDCFLRICAHPLFAETIVNHLFRLHGSLQAC